MTGYILQVEETWYNYQKHDKESCQH